MRCWGRDDGRCCARWQLLLAVEESSRFCSVCCRWLAVQVVAKSHYDCFIEADNNTTDNKDCQVGTRDGWWMVVRRGIGTGTQRDTALGNGCWVGWGRVGFLGEQEAGGRKADTHLWDPTNTRGFVWASLALSVVHITITIVIISHMGWHIYYSRHIIVNTFCT